MIAFAFELSERGASTSVGEGGLDGDRERDCSWKFTYNRESSAESCSSRSSIDMLFGNMGKTDDAVLERFRTFSSAMRSTVLGDSFTVGSRIVLCSSRDTLPYRSSVEVSPNRDGTYECIRSCRFGSGSTELGRDDCPSKDRVTLTTGGGDRRVAASCSTISAICSSKSLMRPRSWLFSSFSSLDEHCESARACRSDSISF